MNKEQTTIERREVPKPLQNEFYALSNPFTEKMIDAYFKAGLGWSRDALNEFAIQCVAMGYYHCADKAEHPTAPTVGLEKKEDWFLFSETKPANKQNIYYWFGGKKEGVYNSHTNTVSGTVKLPKYWKPIEIAPTVENKEDSSSEEWIYDVNEKEGEIHILEPGATVVLATIYAQPLEKEEYDLAKVICSAPRLKQENATLKQSMEELELLLETLIHFTPEDDSIILPLMKGDKMIKDAFEKIGHVSKNKE